MNSVIVSVIFLNKSLGSRTTWVNPGLVKQGQMTSFPLYLCTRRYHSTSVPDRLRETNRDSRSTKQHSCCNRVPFWLARYKSFRASPSLSALQDRSLSVSVKLTEMSWHNALRFWTHSLRDGHDSSQIRFRATSLDTCNYVLLCLDKQNSIVMCTQTQIKPSTSTMQIFNQEAFRLRMVNPNVFISVWLIKKRTNKKPFGFNLSSLKLFVGSEWDMILEHVRLPGAL